MSVPEFDTPDDVTVPNLFHFLDLQPIIAQACEKARLAEAEPITVESALYPDLSPVEDTVVFPSVADLRVANGLRPELHRLRLHPHRKPEPVHLGTAEAVGLLAIFALLLPTLFAFIAALQAGELPPVSFVAAVIVLALAVAVVTLHVRTTGGGGRG